MILPFGRPWKAAFEVQNRANSLTEAIQLPIPKDASEGFGVRCE
jgi:hypothetical protein